MHAVGPGGQWYRLHRLIADLLRGRISDPRTRRDLHRRAADWCRRQDMPLDAVRYALRGGLWPMAAELIGVHVMALLLRGSPREVELLLSAVPRDVLLGHPELAGALAGARILQGRRSEVGELLVAARAGLAGLSRARAERLAVVLDLIEGGYARFTGDMVALAAAYRRVPVDPRRAGRAGAGRLGRGAGARHRQHGDRGVLDRRDRSTRRSTSVPWRRWTGPPGCSGPT